jgi:spore coat protein CotF
VNCPAQSQRGKSKINGDMLGVNSNNSHDMGTTTAEGKSPTNRKIVKKGC